MGKGERARHSRLHTQRTVDLPVLVFHTRMVLSSEPLASVSVNKGDQMQLNTRALWPFSSITATLEAWFMSNTRTCMAPARKGLQEAKSS